MPDSVGNATVFETMRQCDETSGSYRIEPEDGGDGRDKRYVGVASLSPSPKVEILTSLIKRCRRRIYETTQLQCRDVLVRVAEGTPLCKDAKRCARAGLLDRHDRPRMGSL